MSGYGPEYGYGSGDGSGDGSGYEYALEHRAMTDGADAWDRLAQLAADSGRDLEGAAVTGLPDTVQAAATTFLDRWAGYAGESSAIAEGMAAALRATAADGLGIDEATAALYDRLDTALGEGTG